MISIPTVFILGAGASAEYGFPVGRQFRNQICNLASDTEFRFYMRGLGLEDHSDDFIDRFRHSEIGSPDRFLEQYAEYLGVGKHAIAKVLTDLEVDENVFPNTRSAPPWYEIIIDCLDLDSRLYRQNALTILTFNYDRSLEYFLWKVFEARYRGDHRKIRRLWRNKPNIIHLHGKLGEFDPINGVGRPYQPAQPKVEMPPELLIAADGIKIIHEVNPRTVEFVEARKALRNAKRIIFLGFGFDKRNVQRLQVFEKKLDDVGVFGTGVGLTNADHGRIHSDVFNTHTNGRAFKGKNIRGVLEAADLTFRPRS